jgi:molybdopterin synthase catalytic subunit
MTDTASSAAITIRVQHEDFDLGVEYAQIRKMADNPGAIVTFTGLVRDFVDNEMMGEQTLTLEHYPGMTEKALSDIAERACQRWPLTACIVIHRVGRLLSSEQIVVVLVASSHRDAAFSGAEFIMDYLKTEAPFWKKQTAAGKSEWVASRQSDYQRAARWQTTDK